jgi:hypothetical protein
VFRFELTQLLKMKRLVTLSRQRLEEMQRQVNDKHAVSA